MPGGIGLSICRGVGGSLGILRLFGALGILRLFGDLGILSFFGALYFSPIDGALEALVFGDLIVFILTLRERPSFSITNPLLYPLPRRETIPTVTKNNFMIEVSE